VDIVVISNSFIGISPDERFQKLYLLTQDLHPDFQAHGYTTKGNCGSIAVLYTD